MNFNLKHIVDTITSTCPERLIRLMKKLYETNDLERGKVLRHLGIHRNTFNYWMRSRRIGAVIRPLIKEEGRGRGKRLELSDLGRSVIDALIRDEIRKSLPTFRKACLTTIDGKIVPYIKCKAIPAEKIDSAAVAIPVFFR